MLTLQIIIRNSKKIQRQKNSSVLVKLALTPHVVIVFRERNSRTCRLLIFNSFQIIWSLYGRVYE